MPGRPKSTDLKILNGARPSRINQSEPKAEPGIPDAPDWFTEAQRAEWGYLVESMGELGLRSKNERGALIRLACARAGHAEAAQHLADDGATLVDDKGRQYRSP